MVCLKPRAHKLANLPKKGDSLNLEPVLFALSTLLVVALIATVVAACVSF